MTTRETTQPTNPILRLWNRIEDGPWSMVGLLLAAALLRFHDLTLQSLWYDELMTWYRTDFPTLGGVIRSVRIDVWAPGYPLWSWLWQAGMGGESEFILRYPAALAGVLSVAGIYTLGRRLITPRAGLYAALLMTTLQIPIYYSQEARPYAALILHSILSTYWWLRLNEAWDADRDRKEWLPYALGYGLSALVALYYNYFGVVLIGLQAGGALLWQIRRPRNWGKLAVLYAGIGLLYAPWIPETLKDLAQSSYYPPPPRSFIVEFVSYFHFLFNLQPGWVNGLGVLLVLAGITAGVQALRGRPVNGRAWTVLLVWAFVPVVVTWLYSAYAGKTLLVHRYLLISLPGVYLLVALALARLPLPRQATSLLAALSVIPVLMNLITGWGYYSRVTKAQYREAVDYVLEVDPTLPGESIRVGHTGGDWRGTSRHFDYYFGQAGSDLYINYEAGYPGDEAALAAYLDRTDEPFVWYVVAFHAPDEAVMNVFEERLALVETREFYYAQVWLFERD